MPTKALSVTTATIASLALAAVATLAGATLAQAGEQRAMDLLGAVATARGLGNTPIKGGGTNPPVSDDDGDGVANDSDNCPSTPEGESVDSNGCSESQRDDDNDGVANGSDLCPDTPAGEAVDSEGCSESQRDPEAVVRQVYEDDVNPLILRADGGCTSSGCHGRSTAPGGLELYGAGTANSTQLNYESMVRYIGRESADRLTTKISGGAGHGGGTRYPAGSAELATISDWAQSVEALP